MDQLERAAQRWLWVAVALLVLSAWLPEKAHADGAYIPEQAYSKPPAIPTQQAILIYRDGQERLVIESALDAEGQFFGWIIPLPAMPTEFEKATPGALRTLQYATAPDITHDLRAEVKWPFVFAGFWLIVTVHIIVHRGPREIPRLMIFLILIFLIWAMFLPHLGSSTKHAVGVSVPETAKVGSYDVSVLDAPDAEALGGWLDSNGFVQLGNETAKVVADYIAEGWVFVAAKLRREGGGLSVPHPLSMTFPAEKPVYPMRLTAFSGSTVALDLYVVADGQAGSTLLERRYCDILSGKTTRWYGRSSPEKFSFKTMAAKRELAHPSLMELLWKGSVLTRLSGHVTPAAMKNDIALSLSEPVAFIPRVYSYKGAFYTALLIVLPVWSLLQFILVLLRRKRIAQHSGRRWALTHIMLPVTLTSAFAIAVIYLALRKVPVVTHRFGSHTRARWLSQSASSEAMLMDDDIDGMRAHFAAFFRDEDIKNHITGEAIREGDSPGDYQVLQDDRGTVFRAFGISGGPYDAVLKEAK